jgi:hypothetical protein
MIVVTGGTGDHSDLGSLLGIIKERTPALEQLDEKRTRELIRQELAILFSDRDELERLARGKGRRTQRREERQPEDQTSERKGTGGGGPSEDEEL